MSPQFAQDAALSVAATTAILAVLKPIFDALPLAGRLPDAAYNSVLRIIGVAVNFVALSLLLANQGTLDWRQWPAYIIAAAGQQIGSHMLYSGVKSAAASQPVAFAGIPNDLKTPIDPSPPSPPAPPPAFSAS